MLLKKLVFNNFRQFKGKQEVEFSCDSEKNVTVLLGINTGGKTTFVQAFRWVLYDDSNFTDSGKNTQILNSDVSLEMRIGETASASVELTLTHRGVTYLISRVQNYKSRESGSAIPDSTSILKVLYVTPDGQFRRIEERDMDKINSMLPRELSEYFFFDGERIKKVTDRNNVENAVNSIMGLTVIKNMKAHATKAHGKFKDMLVDDGSGKIGSLTSKIKTCEGEITAANEKNMSINFEISSLEKEFQDVEDKINANKTVIEDTESRAIKEKERDNITNIIDTYEKNIMEGFVKCLPDVYLYPLVKETRSVMKAEDLSNKGIPDMNSSALEYILKSGVCICGKSIANDEVSQKHIKELFKYLPPASIGTQVHGLEKDLLSVEADAYDKTESLKQEYELYLKAAEMKLNIEVELNNISMRLENVPDVSGLETKRNDLISRLSNAEERRNGNLIKIETNKRLKEEYDRELAAIHKKSDVNTRTNLLIEYAAAIANRCDRIYNLKSGENIKKLREVIDQVFSEMYHGKRKIEIEDNYSVKLSTTNNKNLDASTGLDTVKNFAFVASLLKMAKDSMNEDADGISSEPYPLVMDAAFSNTDEVHIRNISAQIPKLAQQVIIALMDKDWRYASVKMEPYLGIKYRFNKISETYTEIIKEE